MGGWWRKLWWRALCAWGLVLVVSIAVPLLANVTFVMSSHVNGLLDFAGGAVVHVNPLALLVPPWLAVEAYNLRRKVPVPFGSYVAFVVVFIAAQALTAWFQYAQGIQTGRDGLPFLILLYTAACGTGLAAGWAYARLTRKKVRPEGRL